MIRPAVAQRLWRGKRARPFSATILAKFAPELEGARDHGFDKGYPPEARSANRSGLLAGDPPSQRSRRCANAASRFIRRFEPSGGLRGGVPEHHVGRINKVGVDLGWEKGGTLIWDVRSPARSRAGLARSPATILAPRLTWWPASVLEPRRWSAAIKWC